MQLENVPEEYILPRGAPQVAASNNSGLLITVYERAAHRLALFCFNQRRNKEFCEYE